MNLESHGGFDFSELRSAGIHPNSLIDFSVNINPYGASPQALESLHSFDLTRYPDRHTLELREALAHANDVTTNHILVGNGAAELIWLIAHAFIQQGDTILIAAPTFSDYERAARACAANIILFRASPPHFQFDAEALIDQIKTIQPRLVFLCNPNNPTGTYLSDSNIKRIAEASSECLLILDESYRAFVTLSPFGKPPTENTIVLRSMTKDFAVAGLRLGYAVATPKWIDAMRSYQPTWSVNGAAQVVGLAALNDMSYLRHTLELTQHNAATLRESLITLGADVVGSVTHFCLINVGDGAAWRQQLLHRGCLVRDCASFGLPSHIRIGTRLPKQNRKLVEAWKKISTQNLMKEGRLHETPSHPIA